MRLVGDDTAEMFKFKNGSFGNVVKYINQVWVKNHLPRGDVTNNRNDVTMTMTLL